MPGMSWSSRIKSICGSLPLETADIPGVYRAREFLAGADDGETTNVGDRVAVIGDGRAALDAARAARRLGADTVTVIYRCARTEIPASNREVARAAEEGVRLEFLTEPRRIRKEHDALILKNLYLS